MKFVIGAKKLGKNTLNVNFKYDNELTEVHVGVFHYSDAEEKWNPVGAWKMLFILCNLVGLTEQQLLRRLYKEKHITFNLTAEEV